MKNNNSRSGAGKTALIIGMTGGFGGSVATVLQENGWALRALHRNADQARADFPGLKDIDWISGDALSAQDVARAAEGAAVIVHGANPPGYKNWRGLAIPMLENTIRAASQNGSRIVFPGNVYNFGPETFPKISETAPQRPQTVKGNIRVEMEALLRKASEDKGSRPGRGARVLIVRAGDFFGPLAPSSWFQTVMVKPGRAIQKVTYPGNPRIGHAWAYLPDLARTVGELVAREESLADFEVFHFRGHYLEDNRAFANTIARITGKAKIPLKPFVWLPVFLLSPFVELFRELLEMKYLWKVPVELDNGKLVAFLGKEPHTPLEQALRTTLKALGCLSEGQGQPTAAQQKWPASAAQAQTP